MLAKIVRRLHFRLRQRLSAPSRGGSADRHFVEDYERVVANLIATHPMDEAMSLAVGGLYHEVGPILVDVLKHAGLTDGMALIDLGCGSGRLASKLGQAMRVEYLGTDVVQALLDYAATKSPPHFRFERHVGLDIPAETASADMVCAFSVFTHLLHEETYLYLSDIHRVLRPGGRAVFSFLEFRNDEHWPIFGATVGQRRRDARMPLNVFIEREPIAVWARHLGFEVAEIVDGRDAPWGGKPLGQSLAILRKP